MCSEGSKPHFTDVEAVVYIMDVESQTIQRDLNELSLRLHEQIIGPSPTAKIFCLLHKMDRIPKDQKETVTELNNSPFTTAYLFT